VYTWALRQAPGQITGLLQAAGVETADPDAVVLHQANQVINRALAAKLKLRPDQAPSTLAKYGNTSSATLPVTLVSEMKDELLSRPLRLLLSGFGVGMAIGSVYLETEPLAVVEQLHLPADVFPAKVD
jgi:3-oxoacyl-[acyl-carrier-protein] synthase III